MACLRVMVVKKRDETNVSPRLKNQSLRDALRALGYRPIGRELYSKLAVSASTIVALKVNFATSK